MRLTENVKRENIKNDRMSIVTQMEIYFRALELKYHIYLFISGVCLLLFLGKFDWISGIGWYCFSKFIAMLITKIESWLVETDVMKMMDKPSGIYFSNHLN